jgi:hypothetical protein
LRTNYRRRRDRPWTGFNVHLAAGILREAATLTTQITREVIPSDKPELNASRTGRPLLSTTA